MDEGCFLNKFYGTNRRRKWFLRNSIEEIADVRHRSLTQRFRFEGLCFPTDRTDPDRSAATPARREGSPAKFASLNRPSRCDRPSWCDCCHFDWPIAAKECSLGFFPRPHGQLPHNQLPCSQRLSGKKPLEFGATASLLSPGDSVPRRTGFRVLDVTFSAFTRSVEYNRPLTHP